MQELEGGVVLLVFQLLRLPVASGKVTWLGTHCHSPSTELAPPVPVFLGFRRGVQAGPLYLYHQVGPKSKRALEECMSASIQQEVPTHLGKWCPNPGGQGLSREGQ